MGNECHTGMYCRFGTIHGERITSQTPPLTGSRLVFDPGVTGFFTRSVRSANCNESVLGFDYRGYRYSVGVEAAARATALKTAQSLALFGKNPQSRT
jgi:hypothetical protein